jgi:hypothetical protein
MDSLRGYCCKPSQRTGNRLVILKAPVSTVVMRHLFTNDPSELFQINPLHVYRWSNGVRHGLDARGHNYGPDTSCRPANCVGPIR